MSKKPSEVHFTEGNRSEAIDLAIEHVRSTGRYAELIICKDIPGHHTGGDDCFCGPRVVKINPEELE